MIIPTEYIKNICPVCGSQADTDYPLVGLNSNSFAWFCKKDSLLMLNSGSWKLPV